MTAPSATDCVWRVLVCDESLGWSIWTDWVDRATAEAERKAALVEGYGACADRACIVIADLERARTVAVALEQENAALRAGEDSTERDESCWPTPGQWIKLWNDATPEKRLSVAARVIANAQRVDRCFMEDHEGRLARPTVDICPCYVEQPHEAHFVQLPISETSRFVCLGVAGTEAAS